MSEAIHDPVAFTRLTDQVLQQIQLSSDEDFKQVIISPLILINHTQHVDLNIQLTCTVF